MFPRKNEQRPQSDSFFRDLLVRLNFLERQLADIQTLEATRGYTDAISSYLMLPELVAFWPLSSVDYSSGNALDISGQGRTLTNNSALAYGVDGIIPYSQHDGSADYLSRSDEADLDITDHLTLGCWVYPEATPGTTAGIIGKYDTTGNQKSYAIRLGAGGNFSFTISSDGSTDTAATDANGYSLNTWQFIVGRYQPSIRVKLYVNNTSAENTTSIPSSIFNSTATFEVGAYRGGSQIITGRVAFPFICAAALSDTIVLRLFHVTRPLFGV